MSDLKQVNGNDVSWGSCGFKFGGDEWYGVTKLEYADKRPRTKGYGAGRHQAPRNRSRGKYEVDPVKVTMYFVTSRVFLKALADANDGVNYGDTVFQGFAEFVEGEIAHTTELVDLVVTSVSDPIEEGPDLLMVEIEMDAMYIKRDGLTIFDNSDQQR